MAELEATSEANADALGVDALGGEVLPVAPAPAVEASSDWRKREIGAALRIALKLGSSLLATWGIALVVRLYMPRYLGPDLFGMLNFAEAFTGASFVFLTLGVETYVRKEIALRPAHASDFVGGIVLVRLVMLLAVYAGMTLFLHLTHRSGEVRGLVYIYGIAQFFVVGNATSAGLLQAAGTVNEMSFLNVAAKLLWAAGIVVALHFDLGLWACAVAFALPEGIKSLVLFRLAKKKLGIVARFDAAATWHVIVSSLPFYVSAVATTLFNRVDVSILAVMSSDREVGWYGGAAGLAGLTMLLAPLINWVLVPLFSRAAASSEDELISLVRRSLELIMSLAIPVSLMLILGADLWVGTILGPKFAPAAMAMRILSCTHVLMYLSIVCMCALTMLNRAWHATAVFGVGVVLSPLCNLLFIRPGLELFGPGGGGTACALATLVTELVVSFALFSLVGRRAFDRRLVTVVLKSLAIASGVLAADHWLFPHLGFARLFIGAAEYSVLVLLTGAVVPSELLGWGRIALEKGRARATGR
jgi:O-antigen/teichoic acid export membrane protein